MKKFILTLFLVMCCLPSFAEDSATIRPIHLRNLDVINPNNDVRYFPGDFKIYGVLNDNGDGEFHDLRIKSIYYNKNRKKLSQNTQDIFYNGLFEIKIPNLSTDINSYKVIPTQCFNLDYYSYIKSKLQNILFGVHLGYDMADFSNSKYNTPEKLLSRYDGVLSEFSEIKETYPNGYMLNNGTQIFFHVLNNSCHDFNEYSNERPSEYNACVKMIIDVNGYGLPNKNTTLDEINDRFTFLLYANKLVPYKNSAEEAIINGRPINAILSYYIKDLMRYNYKQWVKSLNMSYTYPNYEIVADNTGNKPIMADIEVKFYKKNGEILETKNFRNWEVRPTYNDTLLGQLESNTTYINIPLDFDKLDKDVEFFDIIITNKKEK